MSEYFEFDETLHSAKTEPVGMNVRAGEIIKFGRYPQGAGGEVAPIEWRVLDVQGDKALLLTDKLLDYAYYNNKDMDVTWEICTLRKWMNDDFIQKAFNSDEQRKIVTVTNNNPDNPDFETKGGRPTKDRVFALSIDEAEKYFKSDESMAAYTTDHAHEKRNDCYKAYKDRSYEWWLRSPGVGSNNAAIVNDKGGIHIYGSCVKFLVIAVRPALWINL